MAKTASRSTRPRTPTVPLLAANRRMVVIALLVVLTMAPVALLSWSTYRLSTAHQKAVSDSLQDYAALAANEYSQRLYRSLTRESVSKALAPFYRFSGAFIDHRNLPQREAIFSTAFPPGHEANRAYRLVRRYLYFDLAKKDVRFGTGADAPKDVDWREPEGIPSMAERKWAEGLLRQYVAGSVSGSERTLVVGEYEGDLRIFMVAIYHRSESIADPPVVYGFEVDRPELETVLRECSKEGPILPQPLMDRVSDEGVVAVVVSSPSGQVIYESTDPSSQSISSTRTLDPSLGNLTVEASLSREAANQLVTGGIPQSHLAEIFVALASSAVLIGLAWMFMRRELILARLRSDFVASVSHELRTPLAQIRLFVDTLLLGRVRSEDDRQRSLEIIDRETIRLGHLVENFLQFSRTERQKMDLRPRIIPPAVLVEDVVDGFQPLADSRKVQLVFEPDETPDVYVDEDALRRVLLNLLDNALKYGPEGQTVEVTLRHVSGGVLLRVDDEGDGIAPDHRERVWRKYWRAHSAVRNAVAGTGIGLFVVKELIDKMGGSVSIGESAAGGARFDILLPLAHAEMPASPMLDPEPVR